ncbi:MAG: 3'-5' exonuclease, partial [Nanoarchaeota archaeon]
MKAFIVYPTYETIDNQTYVFLYGRLENNQSFATINKFSPYFYVRKKDIKKIPKKYSNKETKLTNFKGEPVIKISFQNNSELNNLFKELHKEIEIYEADLRPHYRFIIDNNFLGTINIEGDYVSSEKIDRVYNGPIIAPSNFKPKLKVLSLDTESDKNGNLYCIGLYNEDYKKVLMITDKKLKNAISCKDESDCLDKLRQQIKKIDPDIITGWNVIDHDFGLLRNS